jgi:hypothetical protein
LPLVNQRAIFIRRAVLVAALIAAAVVLWSVVSGDDSSDKTVKPQLLEATAGELSSLASDQGHEVYWAGPKNGVRYEWTRTENGRIYVRYLGGNAKVGERDKAFLTVATYPFKDAVKQLQALAAKNPGSQTQALPDGAFAYYNAAAVATSAYIAFPGSDFEVEVYDPDKGKAFSIAKSGQIEQIK